MNDRLRLRVLDAFILTSTAPALLAVFAVQVAAYRAAGVRAAFFMGSFALGIALSLPYGWLARNGELRALQAAGISPRRTGVSVVMVVALTATCEAATALVLDRPFTIWGYASYVLLAAQLVLFASLALPISTLSGRDEPWALMFLVLLTYVGALVAVRVADILTGWPSGLDWLILDAALLAADAGLYRRLERPRSKR